MTAHVGFPDCEALAEHLRAGQPVFILPLQESRPVSGISLQAVTDIVMIQAILDELVGYVLINCGQRTIIPGYDSQAEAGRRLRYSLALACETWFAARGHRVIRGVISRPTDHSFLEGQARFARLDAIAGVYQLPPDAEAEGEAP